MTNRHKILFYISGHGMGHARRMTAVITALHQKHPQVDVVIRSNAPKEIFTTAGVLNSAITITRIDSGAIEKDVLNIDTEATLTQLRQIIGSADKLIADEVQILRNNATYKDVQMIVADIPFLAGDIAEQMNIPCIGTGNFTWDWIFEPLLNNANDADQILKRIAHSHAKMQFMIRQPFSHDMPDFKNVLRVSPVAHHSKYSKDDLYKILHLDQSDSRPRILLGMRGGIDPGKMDQAVRKSPDFLFTTLGVVPHRSPENLRSISKDGLDFSDVQAVHDVVISKLGYGIVCDCIANNVRLLWPRRANFREEILFEEQAPEHLPMREISREDYANGNWETSLSSLLRQQKTSSTIATNGAGIIADILAELTIHSNRV